MRQLEAIIRLSEALTKMELLPFVEERHVEEAIRLFKVSTIAAAQSGNLSGKCFINNFICMRPFRNRRFHFSRGSRIIQSYRETIEKTLPGNFCIWLVLTYCR